MTVLVLMWRFVNHVQESSPRSLVKQWCVLTNTSLPPANVVCEGYVFTPVSDSVNGGGACVVARGACMVAPGGVGMRGCSGGMRGCSGGCAWLLWGGVRGCSQGGMCGCSRDGWGACVIATRGVRAWLLQGGGMCGIQRDTEIRSMSGRYASYWNAFLCYLFFYTCKNWHFIQFHHFYPLQRCFL